MGLITHNRTQILQPGTKSPHHIQQRILSWNMWVYYAIQGHPPNIIPYCL